MTDILDKIQKLKAQNVACVLVTIIATKGSTPRETGAKMLVCGDGSVYGTIYWWVFG
jgi:xanthine dehydrogenase accessory factor